MDEQRTPSRNDTEFADFLMMRLKRLYAVNAPCNIAVKATFMMQISPPEMVGIVICENTHVKQKPDDDNSADAFWCFLTRQLPVNVLIRGLFAAYRFRRSANDFPTAS